MKIKSQKGSTTIFVLVALLFYTSFLILMYAASSKKIVTIKEKSDILKGLYAKNINNIDELYIRTIAKTDKTIPSIDNIPDIIITNITTFRDDYVQYGKLGGITDYQIFNNHFNSLEEVKNYAVENNQYGIFEININAYGKNGEEINQKKNIEIIRGVRVTNEQELTTAFASSDSLYISVSNNIDCTNLKTINNVAHKLDLNNHSITYTKQNESFTFLTIGSAGELTVLDSTDEKQGSIIGKILETDSANNGTDRENKIYTIENNGTLVV